MARLSSTQIFGNLNVDGEILNKATTTTEGVVQLNDATNSTSTTQAATANAVKKAYDLAAGKAAASHTHNYAGSSSAGGAATSAVTCTGNSTTATKLQTARTINGVSFDGSANITVTAAANGGTSTTTTYMNVNNTEAKNSGRLQFFQKSSDTTINPDSGWWSVLRTQHAGYTNGYWQEMAYSFASDNIKFRRNVNGTISSWKTLAFTDSSITGNAATSAKLQTARTLTIGSTGKTFDGSANVSWTLAEIGAAAASHTHNNIVSRGNVTAESGITGRPAVSGLSMSQAYNNGYPTSYGNVISLKGAGDGQILVGWSGTDGAHAPVYVRSKRDNTTTANWSGWAQFYTSANPQTTVSGNAGTATKLQTARTLTIGSTGKTFDGSANVSWSLAEIGAAAASHTHTSLMATDLSSLTVSLNSYNLSSGTPKVQYYFCPTDGGGSNITGRPNDSNKTAFNLMVESVRWASTTDYITKQTYTRGAEKTTYVRYCTNGTWSSWEKVYTSVQKPTVSEIGAAASSHTHNYAGSSSAGGAATSALACTGNSATATTLQTARTINGTSFNGSANITTANWGTTRTLTVGNTAKSVNGSTNVSWSLSEIGAAAASHSHTWSTITSKPAILTGSGSSSIVEGAAKAAYGKGSHAEGVSCVAGKSDYNTWDYACHAEGLETSATGEAAHSEGYLSVASGDESHAQNTGTVAQGWNQTAIGRYNVIQGSTGGSPNTDPVFIIGNGSSSTRSNAFRVTWAGLVYSKGAYSTSGADYAEMFEWSDGNPNNEERFGYFVTFDTGTEKIRKVTSKDKYILGIVSTGAAIIGDNFDEEWKGKYLRDEWGRIQYKKEEVIKEKPISIDNGITGLSNTTKQYQDVAILSSKYDPDSKYVPRQQRKEWDAVGLLGKLLVYDDGTCEPGDFCIPNDDGIATKSDTGYYVMARESENIIKVLFK